MPNLVSLSLFYTSISKTQENYKHSVEKSEQPGEKDWKIGLIVIQCFEKENKDQTKNRGWLQAKGKKRWWEGRIAQTRPVSDWYSLICSFPYVLKPKPWHRPVESLPFQTSTLKSIS